MDTSHLQPLGDYPESWVHLVFDQFTTLKRGKDLTRDQFRDGSVPVAGSNGVIGFHDAANVKAPGITVGRSGSVGRVTFFAQDFWAHNTALFVTDFHGNDARFASYFLDFLKLGRFGSGASVPTLDRNSFRLMSVVVPPLTEQQEIARVLGIVQRAMEQQERLLALTAELKKTLLHQLFIDGLRHEPKKQTEIGPVPQSWEVVRFHEAVSVTNGQVDPRTAPYNQMIHVGPENIESCTGRLLELQTNAEEGIRSGNYLFTPDDVLYSKIRPYLKKVAIPDFTGTCSADMYPLRPLGRRLRRDFLFQLLFSDSFNTQAISFQDRTGIPKINRQQLGSILIPVPSLDEQRVIAKALSALDAKATHHRRKHATLTDLFRTMQLLLMTAKIRVNDLDLPKPKTAIAA